MKEYDVPDYVTIEVGVTNKGLYREFNAPTSAIKPEDVKLCTECNWCTLRDISVCSNLDCGSTSFTLDQERIKAKVDGYEKRYREVMAMFHMLPKPPMLTKFSAWKGWRKMKKAIQHKGEQGTASLGLIKHYKKPEQFELVGVK